MLQPDVVLEAGHDERGLEGEFQIGALRMGNARPRGRTPPHLEAFLPGDQGAKRIRRFRGYVAKDARQSINPAARIARETAR